jgi:hypothetical protein
MMYYLKLTVYYCLALVRGLLLVVVAPLSTVLQLVYNTVSEWEPVKPLHKSKPVDEDEHLDYLNAEDPYYSKHYTIRRYTKKQHIKE